MKFTIVEQPDIFLFGLRIQEPVTSSTDLLIGFLCIYAYFILKKKTENLRVNTYMKNYFLLMGIATFWGAFFGHAFAYKIGFFGRMPGWYLSMFAIMFFERSAIEHARHLMGKRMAKVLLIANIIELLLMATLTTLTLDFIFVQIHSAYGVLFVVFSFHLFSYVKTKDRGSKIVLIGVGFAAIAAFIYNYPIVIDKWFNQLDFAHILMAIATLVFLNATLNLKENTIKSTS